MLTATITIFRPDNRGEDRPFLVDLNRDRDGDICATCGENVDELRTTNRYGSIETHPTGRLFRRKGEPIELLDDEAEEAEAALSQLESLWNAERARLREIFRPMASEEPSSSTSQKNFPDLEPLGRDASPRGPTNHSAISSENFKPPVHDLLNSCGQSIMLPPGLDGSPLSPPPSENGSGSGMLKTTQARTNTSSSEATSNLKLPPSAVNPEIAPPLIALANPTSGEGTTSSTNRAVRLPSTSDLRLPTSDFEGSPSSVENTLHL